MQFTTIAIVLPSEAGELTDRFDQDREQDCVIVMEKHERASQKPTPPARSGGGSTGIAPGGEGATSRPALGGWADFPGV